MELLSLSVARLRRPPFLRTSSARYRRTPALIGGYALAFVVLHHVAALWATGSSYSLWFPAAGLRFAFLWWVGPRRALLVACAETAMQLLLGELRFGSMPLLGLCGMIGPCLVYGLVIHIIQRRAGRRTPMLRLAPLPFALAAVIGPLAACFASLPWAISNGSGAETIKMSALVSSLVVFTLGDMLGVLIIAPPLIWLADRFTGAQDWRVPWPRPMLVVECLLLTAAAWGIVAAIDWAGLGLSLAPVLLAACWIGLRAGRPGAWATIVLAAAIVLPITDAIVDPTRRLGLHMLLACIAAVGYLAGSFAEAEARSHAEIARRDRMLFQAERLKTLRAMSVAVIHEISQPLSTIAIEAHHLAAASAGDQPDLTAVTDAANLIARKAQDLARMVRRLRRFGDRSADEPSPLPVSLLLSDVAAIAQPEAKAARVVLQIAIRAETLVRGQDIELRQALLNLIRNAIAASPPGGTVEVASFLLDERVHLVVENDDEAPSPGRPGMGVGLIIARSIAEAHGGVIVEDRPAAARVRFTLQLPAAGLVHA